MKARYKARIQLNCPVRFAMGTQVGEGRVLDLTSPGCLIESPVAVPEKQSLQLEMFLPGLKSPFSVMLGVVRWTKGKHFGVEFIKIHESQRLIFDRFMAQRSSAGATTKAPPN